MWTNHKWLKKTPKSPQQVLAVINEANKAFDDWKNRDKKQREKYLNDMQSKGLYVGTLIEFDDANEQLKGVWKIEKILGTTVTIRNTETKIGFRLRNWSINDFKKVE